MHKRYVGKHLPWKVMSSPTGGIERACCPRSSRSHAAGAKAPLTDCIADLANGRAHVPRALAWSGFLSAIVLLAVLFQTVISKALIEAAPTPTPMAATTAALSDGDDVRARFLAELRVQSIESASYVRENTR
jgi:hypothetical protein